MGGRRLSGRWAFAALIAAFALAGCGSGSSSTSTSTATSESTVGSAPGTTSEGRGATAPRGGAAAPKRRSRPEPGGEHSIETYGREAAGSEREAVAGALHDYLDAIAGRDYGAACAHLATRVQRSLEQFAGGSLRRRGCPAILPKLLSPTAPAFARQQAGGSVTRVRVKGARAFVVYHAPGAKLYMMTMAREGGSWKAALLAGSILVPSAATLGQG